MEYETIKQPASTQDIPSGPNGTSEEQEQTSKQAATSFYRRLTRRADIRELLSRLANK
jgi:hypothetical protein